MEHLTKLFHILELTRKQPQYGYAVNGGDMPLSNLAEHQYLVAMLAWQIAASLNTKGAKIDIKKVLELSLVHDLGELFGGDISMRYRKANPEAYKHAKKFEIENQRYLSGLFGAQKGYFADLLKEEQAFESDESRIAKIADYIEAVHFKMYANKFMKSDVELISSTFIKMIQGMEDKIAKKFLTQFVQGWKKDMLKDVSFADTVAKIFS
ncbi:MAG: HD domain-containing protein [Candidatus Pacebacteria bacterium]|nr:HD domain-containing protein [Candidatus Paceibacterota bacterium]